MLLLFDRQACSPLIQLFFGFASDIDQTNINRDIRDGNWLSNLLGSGKYAENVRKKYLVQHGIAGKLNRALLAGEDACIKFYEEHVDEVKANVPPEKLLVFNVKEGWQPLCIFLDLPVPIG